MPTQTITTTAGEATRIAAAVGDALTLSGPASAAQVKQFQIDHLKEVVRAYERKLAMQTAQTTDIAPT